MGAQVASSVAEPALPIRPVFADHNAVVSLSPHVREDEHTGTVYLLRLCALSQTMRWNTYDITTYRDGAKGINDIHSLSCCNDRGA